MSNVTLTDLRNMVERLNTKHDRPTNPNEAGHLFLSTWSPGDGRTRYKLGMIANGGTGSVTYPITERNFTRSEMYAHLLALLSCDSIH